MPDSNRPRQHDTMTVTAITMFKPSDAYKADLSIANPGLKMISALDGALGGYHGIQIENNDIAYIIGFAEKIENFTVVRDNKELFDSIVNALAPTRISGFEQYHLVTISDPFKALSKPVAEVCVFTVKEPISENKQALDAMTKEWAKSADGYVTFGWTFENPTKGFLLSSWDSVEANREIQKNHDVASGYKRFLNLIQDEKFGHVKLTKTP